MSRFCPEVQISFSLLKNLKRQRILVVSYRRHAHRVFLENDVFCLTLPHFICFASNMLSFSFFSPVAVHREVLSLPPARKDHAKDQAEKGSSRFYFAIFSIFFLAKCHHCARVLFLCFFYLFGLSWPLIQNRLVNLIFRDSCTILRSIRLFDAALFSEMNSISS